MSEKEANPTVNGGAEGDEGDLEDKPMTFWEHLDELRKRLVYALIAFFVGCLIAWEFHEKLLDVLARPFTMTWKARGLPGEPMLNFDAPAAAFVSYFRISMIGGAALAAPFIFYQLWSFVAPGLYSREKRYVIPFVGLSTILFIGGGYFGWRVAFPISFDYLLGLAGSVGSQGLRVTPTVMMDKYVDFCTQMLLGFGLTFELPMLLLFLSIAGVINYLHLIKFGRYFILIAFIVAAIFTPPDVPDQLAMAIPLCLLYAISIGLVYLFGKPPTEEQKAAFRNRNKKPA